MQPDAPVAAFEAAWRTSSVGEDFIEFADNGRIRRIVSFDGSPAAANGSPAAA